MTTYKLIFFDIAGIAEPIRFLLSFGGVDFQDVRISIEEWKQLKPDTPLGQLPILEINGDKFFQSRAICRYLAKKFSLYSKNELIALQIDAMVDVVEDLKVEITKFMYERDPLRRSKLKKLALEVYPVYMQKLENFTKLNKGYLATDKITWADMYFSALTETFSKILETDITKDYPNLKRLNRIIRNLPKIENYLKQRPKSSFTKICRS